MIAPQRFVLRASVCGGSPFVPSGLVYDVLLYLVNDMQSILTVYEATTGQLAYQGRLGVDVLD